MTWSDTAFVLVPAVAAWAAVAFKWPALRSSGRHPAVAANILALAMLSCATTLLIPPVYEFVSGGLGLPHGARLLSDCARMGMCWGATTILLIQTHDAVTARRRMLRRLGVLGVVLAALVVAFLGGDFDDAAAGNDFVAAHADDPALAVYLGIVVAVLGAVTAEVAYYCWRYGNELAGDLMRVGLHYIAAAGVLGVLYSVYNAAYVALRLNGADRDVLGNSEVVSEVLLGLATLAIALGNTLPDWGERVAGAARARALLAELEPLWSDLRHATPAIELLPTRARLSPRLSLRDQDMRLYRRLIEIRDGRLALRPYMSAADAARVRVEAAGTSPADLPALLEAGTLAAALDAKARGRLAPDPIGDVDPGAPLGGGDDVDTELAWFRQVAGFYAHSPVVARMRSSAVDAAVS